MTQRRHRPLLAAAALLTSAVLTVVAFTIGAVPAGATGPVVQGSGSTWVAIALDQWRADIAQQGYIINYQAVGSSQGRLNFIAGLDFAASEIPFYSYELASLHRSYQYVPDVAGGTTLMYNIHAPDGTQITSLRLDAVTAGRIFTGGITSWQDPAILALNPGIQIAETQMIGVSRSDGSGTSAQFSLYLASQAPSVWNPFAAQYGCAAPCSNWPSDAGTVQSSGSDGVANQVRDTNGAIGYVEAGYAFERGFPIARLHNNAGNFTPEAVDPRTGPLFFSRDVAVALTHATLNPDLTQNLVGVYNAPEPDAYPMSSYSYLITQTTGFDPAKGNVLGTWMIYIACGGQQEATPLGYSPLPPNLVSAVFAAVQRIPGAPTPPPIDAAHCPNPTITGTANQAPPGNGNAGNNGSSFITGGSTGAGTTSTSAAASSAAAGPQVAAAEASGAGGLGAKVGATPVPVLSQAQRLAGFFAAEKLAGKGVSIPSPPLLIAALVVLVVVFVPTFLLSRERRRG